MMNKYNIELTPVEMLVILWAFCKVDWKNETDFVLSTVIVQKLHDAIAATEKDGDNNG